MAGPALPALPTSLSLNLNSRPTQVLLGALVTLIVAVAYYLFLYSDVADTTEKQRKLQVNQRAEVTQLKQAEISYQRDLAELAEKQQHQRELNTVLPETTEYPAFLSAVQGVANVSGVVLQAWTPQDEISQKFFAKVPMKLSLVGRYHQIAKFFSAVGQLDRIINIENISLANPKSSGEDVELRVDCLATAFHSLPLKGGGK